MIKENKSSIWILTVGAFLAFFVFGFTDNLKGPVLPTLLKDLQINYAMGGTILLGAYLGFMAATMSAGYIADKFGQRIVLIIAGISLAIGVLGFSSFESPWLITIFMAVLGFGLGSLELGCNAVIVNLHRMDKGRYLNLMSVMHGMGSMIAPLYAGWLLSQSVSWRIVYRWDFVLFGIIIVYFALASFPTALNGGSETLDLAHMGRQAFTPRMLWFYTLISVYVGAEIGIASWMVEFLQKENNLSVTQSNQYLSLFFGLIMVGRFVGSFFVERLGYLKSILIAAICASVCLALALLGPSNFSWTLPVSGLFLSIIFPNITASVSDSHSENMNSMLGLLFSFAGLGGLLGPWLVGLISNYQGLKLGFGLNLLFELFTALAAFMLIIIDKQSKFSVSH